MSGHCAPDQALLLELLGISEGMRPDAVYVAGPMRGLPERNLPAFHEAEARLRAAGYIVVNPARIEDQYAGIDWAGCLRRDLAILALRCNQVAVLPGWENSAGATLEVHVARALGMKIIDAITLAAVTEDHGDNRLLAARDDRERQAEG